MLILLCLIEHSDRIRPQNIPSPFLWLSRMAKHIKRNYFWGHSKRFGAAIFFTTGVKLKVELLVVNSYFYQPPNLPPTPPSHRQMRLTHDFGRLWVLPHQTSTVSTLLASMRLLLTKTTTTTKNENGVRYFLSIHFIFTTKPCRNDDSLRFVGEIPNLFALDMHMY